MAAPRRVPGLRCRGIERAFLGVSALLFAASAAVTIVWCTSMSAMGGMPMPGGWTMSMTWMRMPGQTWPGAAGVVPRHVGRDDGGDDAAGRCCRCCGATASPSARPTGTPRPADGAAWARATSSSGPRSAPRSTRSARPWRRWRCSSPPCLAPCRRDRRGRADRRRAAVHRDGRRGAWPAAGHAPGHEGALPRDAGARLAPRPAPGLQCIRCCGNLMADPAGRRRHGPRRDDGGDGGDHPRTCRTGRSARGARGRARGRRGRVLLIARAAGLV